MSFIVLFRPAGVRVLMSLISSLRHRFDGLQRRLERARARSTARRFHALYYTQQSRTWADTRFLGVPVFKCPLDLWVYQEIVFETRPDVIVETGTDRGGSALYLASLFDLLGGDGRVITVDVERKPPLPEHARVTYLNGSSVDPEIVGRVRSMIGDGRVMVVLDSDHTAPHVREELRIYGELVTPGCYMVVEDTNVNGHPVFRGHGPGPMEALGDFMRGEERFVRDERREKFFLTFNPRGYLLRREE